MEQSSFTVSLKVNPAPCCGVKCHGVQAILKKNAYLLETKDAMAAYLRAILIESTHAAKLNADPSTIVARMMFIDSRKLKTVMV